MTFEGTASRLTNWSKSASSKCLLYKASTLTEIAKALEVARAQHLTVIPHGAGHSYTDAALNSGGLVLDLTSMRRIRSWDPANGIMKVEPGVTLRELLQVSAKDGWWTFVSPSTSEATIGGCTAMNVNGRNAWKHGTFGEHLVSVEVLFPSGEACTLFPEEDPELFHAIVGSPGVLGIITAITVQLQQISSGSVNIRRRSAGSFSEILELFAEEETGSDFLEAWVDGFARGRQLGRGTLTSARLDPSQHSIASTFPAHFPLEGRLVAVGAAMGQPVLRPGVQILNSVIYQAGRNRQEPEKQALYAYTFWSPRAFAGYHALFAEGVETFQAFVPREDAQEVFEQVLSYSQQQGYLPVWCIIKQHRRDPFLLSYQVDGFSLELNYRRTQPTTPMLKHLLEHMIATVVEAGGRFYLAKDHFLTNEQYRRSVGDKAVDAFLDLKQRYDPETLLQSDLYRRIFETA